VAAAGLLVFALAGVAFAHGPQGGYQGDGAFCSDTVSELLGLTPEEIQAQRYEGKSLVEIAQAQGVSEDALVVAIMVVKEAAIEQKVEDGILTQEQADLMLQQMEQRTYEAVNRTTLGPFDSPGGKGYGQFGEGAGPGLMRHWGNHVGPGACYRETGLGIGPGGMHRWGR